MKLGHCAELIQSRNRRKKKLLDLELGLTLYTGVTQCDNEKSHHATIQFRASIYTNTDVICLYKSTDEANYQDVL